MVQLDLILLSNDTVNWHINEMANGNCVRINSLWEWKIVNFSHYRLINQWTLLIYLISFVCLGMNIRGYCPWISLFYKNLPIHTTAEYIFNILNFYFTNHNIDWKKCIGLTSYACWIVWKTVVFCTCLWSGARYDLGTLYYLQGGISC